MSMLRRHHSSIERSLLPCGPEPMESPGGTGPAGCEASRGSRGRINPVRFFRRRCLECRAGFHFLCLRKRMILCCRCRHCWAPGGRAGEIERVPVPRVLPKPQFLILGYNDFDADTNPYGGQFVLASQNVGTAAFARDYAGHVKGWKGSRLLTERITVVSEMADMTMLRGEFAKIMEDMWRVLNGQRPPHDT